MQLIFFFKTNAFLHFACILSGKSKLAAQAKRKAAHVSTAGHALSWTETSFCLTAELYFRETRVYFLYSFVLHSGNKTSSHNKNSMLFKIQQKKIKHCE